MARYSDTTNGKKKSASKKTPTSRPARSKNSTGAGSAPRTTSAKTRNTRFGLSAAKPTTKRFQLGSAPSIPKKRGRPATRRNITDTVTSQIRVSRSSSSAEPPTQRVSDRKRSRDRACSGAQLNRPSRSSVNDHVKTREEKDREFDEFLKNFKNQNKSDNEKYKSLTNDFAFWNGMDEFDRNRTWEKATTGSEDEKLRYVSVGRNAGDRVAIRFLRAVKDIERELKKSFFDNEIERIQKKTRIRGELLRAFYGNQYVEEFLRKTVSVQTFSEVLREFYRRKREDQRECENGVQDAEQEEPNDHPIPNAIWSAPSSPPHSQSYRNADEEENIFPPPTRNEDEVPQQPRGGPSARRKGHLVFRKFKELVAPFKGPQYSEYELIDLTGDDHEQ